MVTLWLRFFIPEKDEAVIACKITACVGSKTGTTGLEPATYGLTSHRSNRLSYVPKLAMKRLAESHVTCHKTQVTAIARVRR